MLNIQRMGKHILVSALLHDVLFDITMTFDININWVTMMGNYVFNNTQRTRFAIKNINQLTGVQIFQAKQM